jgi:methylglutaconyl-CoA hydratase
MADDASLTVTRTGTHVQLTLNRPAVRNAFNAELIAQLHAQAECLRTDSTVRTVVIEGSGSHFCAGADLQWMQEARTLSESENVADATRLGRMFAAFDALPQFVIGRVQGAALGGGLGLVAICDFVIATADCRFGFTEVRLGLIPAVISPIVVRKIGLSQARAYFTSGRQFDAHAAQAMGLIHTVVDAEHIDAAVAAIRAENSACAPGAVRAAKALLRDIAPLLAGGTATSDEALLALTAQAIAQRRISAEGQSGIEAFLAHTPPPWTHI